MSASLFRCLLASLQFLTPKTQHQSYLFSFENRVPPPRLASLSFSALFPPSVSVSSPLLSLPLSSSQWDYAKIEAPCRFAVGFKAISCSAPAFYSPYLYTHTHASTLAWSRRFFSPGIFSLAHAECVISSAWCPPLEK